MKRIASSGRMAVFLWSFTAFYAWGISMAFYLLWRDGLPPGDSLAKTTFVFAFFLVGLSLLIWQSCEHCLTSVVLLDGKRVRVTMRYPFRRISNEFMLSAVQPAAVVETQDGEGDPYFYTQLSVGYPFTEPVKIAEGSREWCEAERDKFNAL